MSGTILENLSGGKLSILVSVLLLSQIVCFLIGGLIAPVPASHQNILGLACKDTPNAKNDTNFWVYSRGVNRCDEVPQEIIDSHYAKMANEIVFVFQMPIPREGQILEYSRWQQNLIGVLQMDISFESDTLFDPRNEVTIDARLAYRNKGDPDNGWITYAYSLEKRLLECKPVHDSSQETLYSCEMIPLFELGALHHNYYLLNIRLPVDTEKGLNLNIGHSHELQITAIHQNGGFTKVWVALKTVFFPFVLGIMVWFWRRVHVLQRSPVLLEYMLIYLGVALTCLNLPLEYFTLIFEMPYMLMLSDIRQGIFYATLLSFWLVFAGEHMLVQDSGERNTLGMYWKHLSAVVVGCLSMFVFDICERGIQLQNPFYSIWTKPIGASLAIGFIILGGISVGIYFCFLCFMVWKVFINISIKQTSLPSMSTARRLHYEGLIYRFKFLMLATVICAALTVVGFLMGQAMEDHWKWNDNIEIQLTSAFLTGVYGMWNIYTMSLFILYAPSHKQWPNDNHTSSENIFDEEIEFNNLPSGSNPSEISSLTSFSKKVALD